MKLLIVTDNIHKTVKTKKRIGTRYTIDIASDIDDAIQKTKFVDYLIILLDFDKHHFSQCVRAARALRKSGATISLLAILEAGMVDHRIALLDAGVDYFLKDPFYAPELAARLKAITRREHKYFNVSHTIKHKDITVDLGSHSVKIKGNYIDLKRKEFDILLYFMQNPGRIITRDMIFSNVWEFGTIGRDNTVDVHIKYLRDKIEKPFSARYIHSKYGMGYVLR